MTAQYRRNREIKASRVLLIRAGGAPEELNFFDALRQAEDLDQDLVEINVQRGLPVVKILDFGKFKYEQEKQARLQRQRSATNEIKEMKFRPEIDDGDLQTKTRQIRGFLQDGNMVKILMVFKGREITYAERGRGVLQRLLQSVSDISTVETALKMEGRQITTVIKPKKV